MASPLNRVPLGSVSSVSKPPEDVALAPKIIGAVGLILGILALATFWLPMLKTSLLGWTGIAVGAAGLLTGIAGLVLAAIKKGAGLYVNVAAASTSLVGLVLTVVLAIVFGMFSPATQTVVVAPPPVMAPVVQPPPAPEPEPEPEPEPPPKIEWTKADQSIEQGPIRATITSVGIEKVRLENADFSQITRGKSEPMLRVRVKIENISDNRIVQVPGWTGSGGGIAGKLGGLLEGSELGKTVSSATATANLVDNHGNAYTQTPESMIFGAQTALGADSAVRPGDAAEKQVVFQPPLPSVEFLLLELPQAGFSGSEPLRFEIPKAMITGL